MNVKVHVVDWALEYGTYQVSPGIWLQSSSGAYFKLLEPHETYAGFMETANSMLHLTARCTRLLESNPQITYDEALSSLRDGVGNSKGHLTDESMKTALPYVLQQVEEWFDEEHELGKAPLNSDLYASLEKLSTEKTQPCPASS
eukprot:scaffold2734_cov350-Prasinococcus_capsulatus_cf.AAC.9